MLIELPDHFDYDVSEIRFRVDGKDAKAVIRSLRTPEVQKALRALGESPSVVGQVAFAREMLVSLDCCYKSTDDISDLSKEISATDIESLEKAGLFDVPGAVLFKSEALRDVIYNESAQLAAKFNAKKKS